MACRKHRISTDNMMRILRMNLFSISAEPIHNIYISMYIHCMVVIADREYLAFHTTKLELVDI